MQEGVMKKHSNKNKIGKKNYKHKLMCGKFTAAASQCRRCGNEFCNENENDRMANENENHTNTHTRTHPFGPRVGLLVSCYLVSNSADGRQLRINTRD